MQVKRLEASLASGDGCPVPALSVPLSDVHGVELARVPGGATVRLRGT